MKKIKILILSIFLSYSYAIYPTISDGAIKGRILDKVSGASIEYANIVLLSEQDSSIITGTVSDVLGYFSLKNIPLGNYILEIRFIGFTTDRYPVALNQTNPVIDFGELLITSNAVKLNDVIVKGDRSPVSYQIDKKVIEVDKIQTVLSGSAADVLQNVPSITVDIEGSVSLRGSSNLTVLIDGRPSIMDAQDALQQIPATSIANIEIITNPSAKFDPEGSAGIINIILKKNENLGLSGIMNGNLGLDEKYGSDFLMQYRLPAVVYTFGIDYNKRNSPGSSTQENKYFSPNSTSYFNYKGNTNRGRLGFGIRGGIELSIGQSNFLSLIARYGTREGERNSNQVLSNWTSDQTQIINSQNLNQNIRAGEFAGFNILYTHKFLGKGHELKSEFYFGYRDGNDSSSTEKFVGNILLDGKKATEFGPSREIETKIDYTLPISQTAKFEAGYESEIENSIEGNELFEFIPSLNYYVLMPLYSHSAKYENYDHAVYTIYSDQINNLGLQAGLRSEYTFRKISLINQNKDFTIDRLDFFPTLHSSYKFSEGTQLMASYTRRIQRPHGGELEPFITWTDANNVRVGNPNLLPELIDSYEAGIQSFIGDLSFSTEVYRRVTKNKIDRIRSVYSENVNLTSVSNIGMDLSTGVEFMFMFDPTNFWNTNLMANLYDYRIEGELNSQSFSRKSFNWNSRFQNMFKIADNTQLQLNFNYNSPTVSSQGKWEASYSADLSIKQELFEKLLSITLQLSDLFGTSIHEFSSSGADFYTYNHFTRKAPSVMLNIRFNFNDYKSNNKRRDSDMGNDGDEF